MTWTYLSQLIISLKTQIQQSLLHLLHTRHQLSLDGAGLRGVDADSVNYSSDYFAYLCIPASESTLHQKKCELKIDLTFDDRPQKWSLLAESCGCKAWITVVLQGLNFSNCVALLALDSDTQVSSARRLSDIIDVYLSLASMSFNFPR
jgi:hypothetical protein